MRTKLLTLALLLIQLPLVSLALGDYDRQAWKHWIDTDGDCQNTRAEVLIAQAVQPPMLRANGCSVAAGSWRDPYSGVVFSDPSKLDIDHLVPLKWANDHGGGDWPAGKKRQFANDLQNLKAVDAHLNRQKGDKGPSEWMPPLQSFRCEYLADFTLVVSKYGLQWLPSEKRVVDKMAEACAK